MLTITDLKTKRILTVLATNIAFTYYDPECQKVWITLVSDHIIQVSESLASVNEKWMLATQGMTATIT